MVDIDSCPTDSLSVFLSMPTEQRVDTILLCGTKYNPALPDLTYEKAVSLISESLEAEAVVRKYFRN